MTLRSIVGSMIVVACTTTGLANGARFAAIDTTVVDTGTDELDDSESIDSLASSARWYGSIVNDSTDDVYLVTKQQRRQYQYHTLGELLMRATPFQPLSTGGNGQFDGISILGSRMADVRYSFNGRPLQSNWNNQLNLSSIAPEGSEQLEILTGSTAIGLSPSMSQTAVNIQEIFYNSRPPFTTLWYSQGAGDVVAADVAIAQNVAPGLNVYTGVRRNGANGRFPRTSYDVWNFRLGARYAIDTMTMLGVNYTLTSHNTDLWGGIRDMAAISQFTESTMPVAFQDLRDHERRHDLTIGFDRILSYDSSQGLSVVAYYSRDAMFRTRDTSLIPVGDNYGHVVNYFGSNLGVIARTRHRISQTQIRTAVAVDYVVNDSSEHVDQIREVQPRALFNVNFPLSHSLSIEGSAQIGQAYRAFVYGFGAGITTRSGNTNARLDLSYLTRPPSPTEGIHLNTEKSLLGLAEIGYHTPKTMVTLQTFLRSTADAIVAIPITSDGHTVVSSYSLNGGLNQVAGMVATFQYKNAWFESTLTSRYHYQLSGAAYQPPFNGTLVACGVYRTGTNSIRGGIRFTAVAPEVSARFLPLTWQFIQTEQPVTKWTTNGLDIIATAVVGNASINASFENILAQHWYTTAMAPLITRDFRLSVVWSFYD